MANFLLVLHGDLGGRPKRLFVEISHPGREGLVVAMGGR